MRIEEQVKAIQKQVDYLKAYKDTLVKGKKEKEVEFNATIESLEDAIVVLNKLVEIRDQLIECLELHDRTYSALNELTLNFIK